MKHKIILIVCFLILAGCSNLDTVVPTEDHIGNTPIMYGRSSIVTSSPQITLFTATPNPVQQGSESTLRWRADGSAWKVELNMSGSALDESGYGYNDMWFEVNRIGRRGVKKRRSQWIFIRAFNDNGMTIAAMWLEVVK